MAGRKPHDQQQQQLVRLKSLIDSNDDGDLSSTSSISQDADSDQSSKITDLMKENERKIRHLSESYLNRFLNVGQQVPSLPAPPLSSSSSLNRPLSAATRSSFPHRSSRRDSEPAVPSASFNLFIETLKQLIVREEKKREKSYFPADDESNFSDPYTRLSLGITQCLRDYEAELSHAKRRIHDLNEQQEHILNENKHVLSQLTEAFEQNTISLRQNYEKRLAKQREESQKIGHSLDNYKAEVLTIRESYEKKLRVKDELIAELNDRLNKNETEQAARQHALLLKIEQFQQNFETLQSRNKQAEQNYQIKSKENQDLLQQISNLQLQIQRLQQNVTSKANECTELSQKLASTLPKLAECERFGSEIQQWFSLIAPDHSSANLTLDQMSNVVSTKLSTFENEKKQLELIGEELDNAHFYDGFSLSDRIRNVITHNKQIETSHHDISNKYQALLLQTNMLTGIIKQHSAEVANHKSNEEQLKEFNEQLLNENQKLKIEIQEFKSKILQMTNTTNQYEHECTVMKQHARDLQIQYETSKTEHQMLTNELKTKREAMKRYEQEIQSLKQFLEITMKEKQIQSDQIKHERQLFQSESETLKQLVIRDSHDKSTSSYSRPIGKSSTTDEEIQRLLNSNDHDGISRRATSTPTPRDNENASNVSCQSFGITKQIDQVLNEMKSLLTHGREVMEKQDESSSMIPERDLKMKSKKSSVQRIKN